MIADEQGFVSLTFYKIELGLTVYPYVVVNELEKKEFNSGSTILFFQENAGNIAHRLEMVQMMLQRLECNIFLLSYRGYGASDGSPSQHGITKDAQAALDHLVQRTDIDTSRIVVFGRSLGVQWELHLPETTPKRLLR